VIIDSMSPKKDEIGDEEIISVKDEEIDED